MISSDRMIRLKRRVSLAFIILTVLALLIIGHYLLDTEEENDSRVRSFMKINDSNKFTINSIRAEHEEIIPEIITETMKSSEEYKYERSTIYKGHKIIHLDLKGAPPKITYYEYLFRLFKILGATGVLIEYEDMFPFEGNLIDIKAGNNYIKEDLMEIQNLARKNDLFVIPLIQTFGHLEFVLKLNKYRDLREVDRYPQSICPTHDHSLPFLYEVIDQVVSLHTDLKYLHIGADEVYQLGECNRCIETLSRQKWGKRQLFLNHVTKLAKYIKKKYPHVTVLMWDDEFRDIDSQELIKNGLNYLIEPVIWKYTTDPESSLTSDFWNNYSLVWSQVWIATAFKGATGPDKYYTDISYHVENHRRWLEIIEKYSSRIKFQGMFLTGWQRYDHFSVLCELLPTALPSLAVNMALLRSSDPDDFPIDVPDDVMDALSCVGSISLNIPEPQYGWTRCNYPGTSVYAATLKLFNTQQEFERIKHDNTFKGWLSRYNMKYSFSSPIYVERAIADLDSLKMEVLYLEKEIKTVMMNIYDNYTIMEWLETYLEPLKDDILKVWEAKERILRSNSWPRRPLVKADL